MSLASNVASLAADLRRDIDLLVQEAWRNGLNRRQESEGENAARSRVNSHLSALHTTAWEALDDEEPEPTVGTLEHGWENPA